MARSIKKFTDKQQVFINEYLKCWNATEAAIKAGYSERSARSIASENLTKPNILEAIQGRIDEMKMSADEALVSLSDIARGSVSDFINVQTGVPILDFTKAERNNKLHLVKKLTYGKGTISFEMHDKLAALNTIARHHGVLNEKIEIDIHLMGEVTDALQKLGQDPSAIFNEIIARAKVLKDAGGD